MPTPSELVTEAFANAQTYATEARTQLAAFTAQLNSLVQNAPLVDVTFASIPSPGASTAPTYDPPDAYVMPADYTSPTMDALRAGINSRLGGGTGLDTTVEQEIWDRARERELVTMQANIDQVTRDSEAMGFALPPGVLADAIRRETRGYYDKVSTLSRDIAVKQAELEQTNLLSVFEQGTTFEKVLSDIALAREKMVADIELSREQAAVATFEAQIKKFLAEVEQDIKQWEASVKQYDAIVNYTINGQKINADITRANLSAALEAGKVGAQVYAQLTASAYSLIHASASVNAGAQNSVSYSYSNDTATAPAAVTAV